VDVRHLVGVRRPRALVTEAAGDGDGVPLVVGDELDDPAMEGDPRGAVVGVFGVHDSNHVWDVAGAVIVTVLMASILASRRDPP
jgi:hypothetical protein